MTDAAILLYLDGAPRDKQEAACLRHCAARGYQASTLVFHAADALALLRTGQVGVIVAAYTPASGPDVAAEVEAAGGRVEQARRGNRLTREVGDIIDRLLAKKMTVAEVAEVVELDTSEIRLRQRRRRNKCWAPQPAHAGWGAILLSTSGVLPGSRGGDGQRLHGKAALLVRDLRVDGRGGR